jgi:hypothetical protein
MNAIVTEKDAAAASRLMTAAPASDCPMDLGVKLLWYQEEAARAAAFWSPMVLEQHAVTGAGWHVFPNLIFLPSGTGTMTYRSRPWGDGTDSDWCMFNVWSLEQYAPVA